MKSEYDFSHSRSNPYVRQLKKQVTIRLDGDTILYFRKLSDDNGIPYQTLINLYLKDCAIKHKKISLDWK